MSFELMFEQTQLRGPLWCEQVTCAAGGVTGPTNYVHCIRRVFSVFAYFKVIEEWWRVVIGKVRIRSSILFFFLFNLFQIRLKNSFGISLILSGYLKSCLEIFQLV